MENNQSYPNSLLKRFRIVIIGLYAASLIISIPVIYFITKGQVYSAANQELSLLVDMVKSVREYIAEDVRADLMKANLFHSPAISSTVTTSMVASHFREKQPDYYIKVASNNPLNLKNKPEPLEDELLARYQANGKLTGLVETGIIDGKKYLVSSRPSKAKESCLVCHGNPGKAPEAITVAYGKTNGYNYKVGNVVGVSVVGVPLADVNALVTQRVALAAGLFTLLFGIIFFTINNLVHHRIIMPVVRITTIARSVSQGDLERKIDVEQDGSEIGELGHAIELLRRSLVYTMKKMD